MQYMYFIYMYIITCTPYVYCLSVNLLTINYTVYQTLTHMHVHMVNMLTFPQDFPPENCW